MLPQMSILVSSNWGVILTWWNNDRKLRRRLIVWYISIVFNCMVHFNDKLIFAIVSWFLRLCIVRIFSDLHPAVCTWRLLSEPRLPSAQFVHLRGQQKQCIHSITGRYKHRFIDLNFICFKCNHYVQTFFRKVLHDTELPKYLSIILRQGKYCLSHISHMSQFSCKMDMSHRFY